MLNNIRNIFVVLAWLSFAGTALSQNNDSTRYDRNFITSTFSYHYLYDPTPITQFSHLDKGQSTSSSFGIKYLRKVNELNGWSTSLCFYNFVLRKETNSVVAGDVRSRYFFSGQANYQRNLFHTKNGSIEATLGINCRIGQEQVHIAYVQTGGQITESIILLRSMFDIGVPLGIEVTRLFGNHFHIRTRLSHTFFPYINEKKNPFYDWDRGSPRNMTSLTFGLGVNF